MGLFPSRVRQDELLLAKLAKAEFGEGDATPILRRSNSLVLELENFLEGRVDNVEPEKILQKETHSSSSQDSLNDMDEDEEDEQERLQNPQQALQEKLIVSVAQGDFRVLRSEIVHHMATINHKFRGKRWRQMTLLHVASQEGYARMVEYATDPRSHSSYEVTEVDVNPLDLRQRAPLHLAFTPPQLTYCGKRFGVASKKALCTKPESLQSLVDWEKPGGAEERQRCVAALLLREANPNLLDFHDYSALHYATMYGWTNTVQMLLEKGADPYKLNVLGQNVLHLACKYKHRELTEKLLEELRKLDINGRDGVGDTPLIYALRNNDDALTELLLDFGADVRIENYRKCTPLHVACEQNCPETVNLLLDFKAPRDKQCFELMKGEGKRVILARMAEEEAEAQRKVQAKQELQAAARRKALEGRGPGDALGQWVPYKDKRGRGVFYYNRQWEQPKDYVHDRTYAIKTATYGMSFYH